MIHRRRRERCPSNHLAKSLRYGARTLLVGAAEHDKELIARPPAHLTFTFDFSSQAGGKFNQHVLAGLKAIFVIDLPEVVYVHKVYSGRLGGGPAQLLRKKAEATGPIPKVGERVALRLVTQSGDLLLARLGTLSMVKHVHSDRLGGDTAQLLREEANATAPIPKLGEVVAHRLVTESRSTRAG